MRGQIVGWATGAMLLAWPRLASANAGLPMLPVSLFEQLVGFVPIVAVEAWLLWRWHPQLRFGRALWWTTRANTVSTLLGVPMAWLALVLVGEAVGMPIRYAADQLGWTYKTPTGEVIGVLTHAAWLHPSGEYHWRIPMAALALTAPFFLVSWWAELRHLRDLFGDAPMGTLRRTVGIGNAATYAAIAVVNGLWLHNGLAERRAAMQACVGRQQTSVCRELGEQLIHTYSADADVVLPIACRLGDASVCQEVGWRAHDGGDRSTALRAWRRACQLGGIGQCQSVARLARGLRDEEAAAELQTMACQLDPPYCCRGKDCK